jgi:quercetin dioxygenase-like cupin family protein
MNAGITTPPSVTNLGQDRARILIDPGDFPGPLAVVDVIVRRDHEPPLQRYRDHDLLVCVIQGELTVELDGDTVAASSGAIIRLPRGTEHGYAITTETAHLLVIVTPSGPETYIASLHGPEPCATIEDLVTCAAHHGIEITGPKPTCQECTPWS